MAEAGGPAFFGANCGVNAGANCGAKAGAGQELGNWPRPVNVSDPQVKGIANFAVNKHNENNTPLEHHKVIGGVIGDDKGIYYILLISANGSKYYEFLVSEDAGGKQNLIWWKDYGSTCS